MIDTVFGIKVRMLG